MGLRYEATIRGGLKWVLTETIERRKAKGGKRKGQKAGEGEEGVVKFKKQGC